MSFYRFLTVRPLHPMQCCNIRDKSGCHMGSNLYVGCVCVCVCGGGGGMGHLLLKNSAINANLSQEFQFHP